MTRARGALQNAVRSEFGVQMQRRYRARLGKLQGVQAKVREGLGMKPEYGAPVLMPPTDRLSGALSIASTVIGIAGGLKSLGAFGGGGGGGFDLEKLNAGGLGSGFDWSGAGLDKALSGPSFWNSAIPSFDIG